MKVTGGQLLCLQNGSLGASQTVGTWPDQSTDLPALPPAGMTVVDDLPAGDPLRHQLEFRGIRIIVALKTRERLVGYLLLGVKSRGDIFSKSDITALETLSSQLAVAIVAAQAYEQISQFNDTLQKEIAAATASLREAQQKLELDDRMKTEFIMLTSHHLRTPISIIKGYTEMLEESRLSSQQREWLEWLKSGTTRLSRFTEDLITIDSIIAGDQLELHPVNISDILNPLIEESRELAKAKGLVFKTALASKPVTINANPLRLKGAIQNLLDNAFKFTKAGQITFSTSTDSRHLIITVADTGIGIAASELPHLFSRFHRATGAPNVQRFDYEGEGIGLYLSNLIISEHGGRISVTSHLGQGSSFKITLPLKV